MLRSPLLILLALMGELSVSNGEARPSYPGPYLPAQEELSQQDLSRLVSEWDQAMRVGDLKARGSMLVRASNYQHGLRTVRYSNDEIQKRVVDQYFAERALREDPSYTVDEHGEYMTSLETMAESTFSPRLYETILWDAQYGGKLRELYLAKVNAGETLDQLFAAKLGKRPERAASPETFYTPEDGKPLFSVIQAFEFLSLASEISPATMVQRRDAILAFVTKYATRYREPRKATQNSEPQLYRLRDFKSRSYALDVLNLIATPDDVNLVQDIAKDLPPPRPEGSRLKESEEALREELQAKADEIIARLTG